MFHCLEGRRFIRIWLSLEGLIILNSVTVKDRQNGAKVRYVIFMFMHTPCIFIVYYLFVRTNEYIYLFILQY